MSAGDQDRDVEYLRTVQYRDSSQLAKRASLHVRYRTAPVAAFDMFASLIDWPAGGRVLDVGTGAGGLWEHVAAVAPDGLRLVLSDLSAGMVDEAVDRARATGRFASVEGRVCDARDLPFSDASFDVVVSTYALYHVPEPAKAVAELARVVAPDGTVGIMTDGPGHMREIEAIRVEVFGEAGRYTVNRLFTPGDAAMMLIDHFGEVCWHRYDDALRVTAVDHVLDFITSSPPANSATPEASGGYLGAVAFEVACASDAVRVELSGWDRLLTWRRSLVVDLATVPSAFIEDSGALEADIDHRAVGFGTHNGGKRPGRRRVGAMLGRGVPGRQFWAVSAGAPTVRLLVLEPESGPFARVVLEAGADVESCVIAAVSAS